jgi:hypothetical protein
MESFVCFIGKVLEPLGHVMVSFIAGLREHSQTARAHRACERQRDEWKSKYLAEKLKNQIHAQQIVKLWAVIAVLVVTVIPCMIFPQERFLFGCIGLSFVLGGLLLPVAHRLGQYACEVMRHTARGWQFLTQKMRVAALQIRDVLSQRTERIGRDIQSWSMKWKAVLASRIFRPTP